MHTRVLVLRQVGPPLASAHSCMPLGNNIIVLASIVLYFEQYSRRPGQMSLYNKIGKQNKTLLPVDSHSLSNGCSNAAAFKSCMRGLGILNVCNTNHEDRACARETPIGMVTSETSPNPGDPPETGRYHHENNAILLAQYWGRTV